MKKIMLSSIIFSFIGATTITPYISFIDYSKDTSKDNANVYGLYLSNFKTPYKIEIDAEYMTLNYKNSPTYKQTDLTIILNYFKNNNYIYRAGIHNIFASNPETITRYIPGNMMTPSTTTTTTKYNNTYDFVIFGGLTYYEYLKFNTKVDFYYSDYQHLNVYQISPSYGFNFGNYYSNIGSFYLQGKINFIKLSNSDAAPKDNYVNVDVNFQNFKGPWTTTLKLSLGKSAYKVAEDGFVVYNLGDEYKSAYSLSVSKKLKNNDYITGGIEINTFEETKGYEASSTTYLINYTHNL